MKTDKNQYQAVIKLSTPTAGFLTVTSDWLPSKNWAWDVQRALDEILIGTDWEIYDVDIRSRPCDE